MKNSTTPSVSDICRHCGSDKSLGGKILKPGECNVCVVVEDMDDAIGGVLVKHFPEAESGDVSPLVALALSQALTDLAKEWIPENVPGASDEHA